MGFCFGLVSGLGLGSTTLAFIRASVASDIS